MSARQVELGLRVIERRGLFPRSDVVARFAAALRVRRAISLMHVAMTFDASHGIEVVALGWRRRRLFQFGAMALATGGRDVASKQLKSSLLVARQRECRWPEAVHGMALFALIRPTAAGELSGVRVLVAIQTSSVGHLVARVLAGGDMTLGALHSRMFAHQRILALLMHTHVEQ